MGTPVENNYKDRKRIVHLKQPEAKITLMLIQEIKNLLRVLQENPREYMRQVAKEKNPPFNSKYERFFAKKEEVEPKKIEFELELVSNNTAGEIFRSAMSFWSVPISVGYGRRMRFIVWDKTHNKVFGIFGLCDPLIGLKVRDDYIGWDKKQKEERLYNMMTTYVLGQFLPSKTPSTPSPTV